MAVKLRLRRMGNRKRPFYRLVAADSRCQRDGRFLDILGYYDPMVKPYALKIDREKVLDWLNKGAQMSETAESLLRKEGIIQDYNRGKMNVKQASESNAKKPEEASDAGEVNAEA